MNLSDIKNIEAEAGIIATAAVHPDFTFFSEDLSPRHFSDKQNGWMYFAIREIAKREQPIVDGFNIHQVLYSKKSTEAGVDILPISSIDEFLSIAPSVARSTKEEYRVLVDNVRNKAFARESASMLEECKALCYKEDVEDLQQKIYQSVEDLIYKYQRMDELKLVSQQADEIWDSIDEKTIAEATVDFPFPSLNKYCRLERSEAIVLSARQKRGKSIFMMNVLIKAIKEGKKAIYIDTELPTKKFLHRILAHLAQVEYSKIRDKALTEEESERVNKAINWVKKTQFVHIYVPVLDDSKLISLIKRAYHTYQIDAVFLDYIKSNGEFSMDAYKNSAALGRTLDLMKNYIGGTMNLFVMTAVQATATGEVAFSQGIRRNCSALMYLERKDEKQFSADGGADFGNMRLTVQDNRNGEIMADDEYISLTLDGNRCTFKESLQPERVEPY